MSETTIKLPTVNVKYILILFILFIAVTSSFYTIQEGEKGVVKRFGKYTKTVEPGLHFKIPFGIDQATKINTKIVRNEEFGFRTKESGVVSQYYSRKFLDESLMLTGDLNSVVVEWAVQYKIDRPDHYLFNIRDKRKNIRDLAESVMRHIVGDRSVDEVLTIGREEIAAAVADKLQEILNTYNAGIKIYAVNLQDINPPQRVQASFNDVNKAKQDKDRLKNEAQREYNKNVALVLGEKDKLISRANGYKIERVNRAQGDVSKYNKILSEYKKAPDITKKRIYLEEMESILSKIKELKIISGKLKSIYPLLNLDSKGGSRK